MIAFTIDRNVAQPRKPKRPTILEDEGYYDDDDYYEE
jgi:hypothetical protein